MKRLYSLIALASLVTAAALPSRAQSSERVTFQAPFAFSAGEATFPAGAYYLTRDENGRAFMISSESGPRSAILVLGGAAAVGKANQTSVTFIQRHGRYYLDSMSLVDGTLVRIANAPVSARPR
jgi:hypothetical protein